MDGGARVVVLPQTIYLSDAGRKQFDLDIGAEGRIQLHVGNEIRDVLPATVY